MNSTANWGMTRVLGWGAAGVVALTAITGIAEATTRTATSEAPARTVQASAAQEAPVQRAGAAPQAGAAAAPAGSTETKAGKRNGCRCKRQAARRPVHGEFVVRVKDGFRTVRVQRGEVTGSNASSLTVKSADGYTATWNVTKDSRVRKAGKQVALTELKAGDRVLVRGPKSEDGNTARIVRANTPKPATKS